MLERNDGAFAHVGVLCCALVATGAACSGDPQRDRCSKNETAQCTCPEGDEGLRSCVRGVFGPCVCGGSPLDRDAGPLSFGNRDGSIPTLPDAALVETSPDARVIEADVTCGEQESQAEISEERPVDVIFMIDNSGSMSEEIESVERNINQSFAQIIEASGADYRVIMLTDHGSSSLNVCVEPPLASAPCSDSTSPTGTTAGAPANGPRFFHYDINVQSTDSVCLMLTHYLVDPLVGPFPQTGQTAAPTGWNEWLREDALKVFVEITDDRLSCSATTSVGSWTFSGVGASVGDATRLARDVYAAIQTLSPQQFGTPAEPKFIWHSIVGIIDNDPLELPYTHFDPPRIDTADRCATAVNPGSAYQMLSIATAGLRYPVCAADAGEGYDAVFRAIAHEVVRGSRVECAFNIPSPPPGKFVDYESVEVRYTPGDGGAEEAFGGTRAGDCDDRSFYFDDGQIKLCREACERVRADDQANVSVVFQCGPEVELDPDVF